MTLCRMNALDIPLSDGCVDVAVANSVLHLISNPEKVIREIYRVLKPGGVFMCLDDAPGKQDTGDFDNSLYFEIVNSLYAEYWELLGAYGIKPKKYSWHFDRDAVCNEIFREKKEKLIQRDGIYEIPLSDGFLPRFCGRGFSDQTDVPKEMHDEVIGRLLDKFREKYGDDFDTIVFRGSYVDMMITVYTK